ncbi:MAG: PAS domain S-box protein [Leptospirales bacterium]|nr:PAS domain S-box protein [Leptospirales bacterium]
MDLVTYFKRGLAYLAPKQSDPDRALTAQLLYAVLFSSAVALTLYGVGLFLLLGDRARIETTATTLFLVALVYVILRTGHLKIASVVGVVGSTVVLSFAAFLGRGVSGVSYSAFVVITVAAGLLLGRVAALAIAITATLAGGIILWAQGVRDVQQGWSPQLISWLGESMLFFISAFMIGSFADRLRSAAHEARKNQKDKVETEEHFRATRNRLSVALDSSQLGIWEWKINTNEVYWSDTLEKLFRLPPGGFKHTYEHYLELIHPDDRAKIQAAIGDVLSSRSSQYEVQHRILTADGLILFMECRGRLLRSEDGAPASMVGTVMDITDRVESEAALARSEDTFRSLVKNLTVGVLLQGPHSEILLANPAAFNLLGLSEAQILGRTSFDPEWNVIGEDGANLPGNQHPVPRAIATRQPVTNVVMGVQHAARGERVWLLVNAVPLLKPDGSVSQVICTFTDISATKRTQSLLSESEDKYRSLVERSPDGVAVHQDRVFTFANQALANLLGYSSPAHLVGRPIFDIVPPDFRDFVTSRVATLLHQPGSEVPPMEQQLLRADGGLVDVESRAARVSYGGKPAIQVMFRDITARKHTERLLLDTERRYREVIDRAGDGIFLIERSLKFVDANATVCDMLGYSQEELLTMTPVDILANRDEGKLLRFPEIWAGQPVTVERMLRRKDGSTFAVEVNAKKIHEGLMLAILRDVSARKATELAIKESEEKWRTLAESVPDFAIIVDEAGIIDFINHIIPGWRRDQVIGRPFYDFHPPEQHDQLRTRLSRVFATGIGEEYEHTGAGAPGEIRHYNTRMSAITQSGKRTRVLIIATDITGRKRDLQRLEYQASHDSLTDLPNRQYMIESSLHAIDNAERTGNQVALLLLDLDRFKEINDTLGHYTGDLLLKRIGPRLQNYLHSVGAQIARLGGDEFAILIPKIAEPAEAESIAQTVHKAVREPFLLDGMNLELDSSIGVAIYPLHGKDPISLLRCADVAMYIAKRRSAGVAMYSPDQDRYSRRRLALLTELGLAIREDQLTLHYQPKYMLLDQKCVGAEVLVRWQHPNHGTISPGEFIPLAEMGNLIMPLTHWVLENALRQWRAWKDTGITTTIAVNLSVRNLMDEQYPVTVESLLKKFHVDPGALELEITESAIMADPERALSILNRLHGLGVELSIDDFGTGYSSLSYLSRLPIDSLKIDLSFVRQMRESERNTIIVNSTIRLAHTLGLRVVAEGVEDLETLLTLAEMKCDMAQGFFLAPPMKAIDVEEKVFRAASGD